VQRERTNHLMRKAFWEGAIIGTIGTSIFYALIFLVWQLLHLGAH